MASPSWAAQLVLQNSARQYSSNRSSRLNSLYLHLTWGFTYRIRNFASASGWVSLFITASSPSPECRGVANPYGDHQVGCGGNSDHIHVHVGCHNAVCDVIFSAPKSATLAPSWEAYNLVEDSPTRPADVLLPNGHSGRPAALGIHIPLPWLMPHIHKAKLNSNLFNSYGGWDIVWTCFRLYFNYLHYWGVYGTTIWLGQQYEHNQTPFWRVSIVRKCQHVAPQAAYPSTSNRWTPLISLFHNIPFQAFVALRWLVSLNSHLVA